MRTSGASASSGCPTMMARCSIAAPSVRKAITRASARSREERAPRRSGAGRLLRRRDSSSSLRAGTGKRLSCLHSVFSGGSERRRKYGWQQPRQLGQDQRRRSECRHGGFFRLVRQQLLDCRVSQSAQRRGKQFLAKFQRDIRVLCSTGRCSTAAARIPASSRHGGLPPSWSNSSSPREPAVSAARITRECITGQNDGAPRRRSAAAR